MPRPFEAIFTCIIIPFSSLAATAFSLNFFQSFITVMEQIHVVFSIAFFLWNYGILLCIPSVLTKQREFEGFPFLILWLKRSMQMLKGYIFVYNISRLVKLHPEECYKLLYLVTAFPSAAV